MRAFGHAVRRHSRSTSLPPPVNGWNTRDALADMGPEFAIIMDNWFPGTDDVRMRRGYTSHATGMTGAIDTLLEYTAADGDGELFAANAGDIYDVTAGGAIGAAVVTGQSNDRYQQVQIGTAGGHFLLAVNGADTPQTYNGSAWADATMTGPTIANLIWTELHQRRLWFGEEDSLSAWYLGVNAITGAATEFPLAAIAKLGGYIMAMGTWTRDAGDGQDDVAVFVTSEGEAIVYSGTDPASAATWALVGVFRIGKPIGRRCLAKVGGDIVVITQTGFVPLSQALLAGREQAESVALSAQIKQAVNDEVVANGSLFGWQPFIYPLGTMLIVNIPQSSTTARQHVFNTITGAPCRFTGVDSLCWALLNGAPYFGGGDGVVYKFDDGSDDGGTDIASDCLQAFSYFSSPGVKKAFKTVEPIFNSTGSPNPALDLNLDFKIESPSGVEVASPVNASKWGVDNWGVAVWGGAGTIFKGWRGVRGMGRAAALRIRITSSTSRPSWVATHYIYVPGGQI